MSQDQQSGAINLLTNRIKGKAGVERATAWRSIDELCASCGKPLWGRTVTTEVAHSLTPARVETQTRWGNDDCAQSRV